MKRWIAVNSADETDTREIFADDVMTAFEELIKLLEDEEPDRRDTWLLLAPDDELPTVH